MDRRRQSADNQHKIHAHRSIQHALQILIALHRNITYQSLITKAFLRRSAFFLPTEKKKASIMQLTAATILKQHIVCTTKERNRPQHSPVASGDQELNSAQLVVHKHQQHTTKYDHQQCYHQLLYNSLGNDQLQQGCREASLYRQRPCRHCEFVQQNKSYANRETTPRTLVSST